MNSDKEKFYSLIPNYAAVKEAEDKYHKNQEKELREFLDFWQDVYDIWSRTNTPDDLKYINEKIRIRKSLITTLGIRD